MSSMHIREVRLELVAYAQKIGRYRTRLNLVAHIYHIEREGVRYGFNGKVVQFAKY